MVDNRPRKYQRAIEASINDAFECVASSKADFNNRLAEAIQDLRIGFADIRNEIAG